MDLRDVAAFFQQDGFDAYDFGAEIWDELAFRGKLKFTTESFGVNDLSSKKRMLFTQPDQRPTSSVIRHPTLNTIYLVENPQGDVLGGEEYQTVYNVHEVRGPAQLYRTAPEGPSINPGWAINRLVQNTFADVSFQRVPMDQESSVNQYGLYLLYLPHDCPAVDHDTVVLDGHTYFLFEVYWDQGLRVARCTNKPDLRVNIVYTSVSAATYDPGSLTPGYAEESYNVTAQIEPVELKDTASGNLVRDAIKVLIDRTWIGVVPKINDRVTANGKTYKVSQITQNMVMDQWMIIANV